MMIMWKYIMTLNIALFLTYTSSARGLNTNFSNYFEFNRKYLPKVVYVIIF